MCRIQSDVNTEKLVVNDQTFYAVNSTLLFLKMLQEYLESVHQLPLLHSNVLQSIIELLKVFNSRTCQLVLGAGAMHVAQLRSITAKHLGMCNAHMRSIIGQLALTTPMRISLAIDCTALAAQTVSLLIEVIPHLKQCLAPFFSTEKRVLLNDLERVLQVRSHRPKQASKQGTDDDARIVCTGLC
jgi:vacuolar protein sorting-associated protein 54